MTHEQTMRRVILAWGFVVACLITGWIATHHGEVQKENKYHQDEFARMVLSEVEDKPDFLRYLGYPGVIKDNKHSIILEPETVNEKKFVYDILVDGKKIGTANRQKLEAYFPGRQGE